MWASKLQTEIALSTIDAEYIALSQAMRESIPLIYLLNEMKGFIKVSEDPKADFKYKVFKDNNGYIELAKCLRIRPKTKHIGIKYHPFRSK
eukprot:14092224-Ditylum_brightwellii.AAC.1